MEVLFTDCKKLCSVSFPAGSKKEDLPINIIDDNTTECNETFSAHIDSTSLPGDVSIETPGRTTVFVNDDEESKQLANILTLRKILVQN